MTVGVGAVEPHIGFKLPNCGGVLCEVEWATVTNIIDLAHRARDLAYDSVWLHDHLVTPKELRRVPAPPFFEPLTVMGAVASAVPDVAVGVATLILPMRDPVLLAKQIATLDAFYPKRCIIGVGLGQYESEFQAFGIDTYRARGRVANEYLDIMEQLFARDSATYRGEHRSVDDAQIHPKPRFPHEPAVWVGGNSERAFSRAARYGAGWIFSTAMSPNDVQHRLSSRESPTTPFAVALTATVSRADNQPQRNHDREHRIHQHSSTITGDASEVAGQLSEYVSSGVTHMLLTFRSADLPMVHSQMAWFQSEVRPQLKTARKSAAGS